MDKQLDLNRVLNHKITIGERKNILITGVKKLTSFDVEEFLMETIMGTILLKGKDLEIIKLDTIEGTIAIKGLIISFLYLEDKKNIKDNGFIAKLFK